jgi:hypothetical protein
MNIAEAVVIDLEGVWNPVFELFVEKDCVMVTIDRQKGFAAKKLNEPVPVLVPPFHLTFGLVGRSIPCNVRKEIAARNPCVHMVIPTVLAAISKSQDTLIVSMKVRKYP